MVTKAEVEKVLRAIQDPELGMDIFTLGLIYKAEVNGDVVNIEMTFTSPMCPYGPQLVREIKEKIGQKPFPERSERQKGNRCCIQLQPLPLCKGLRGQDSEILQ